jgi:aminoacrylate hydrolase
MTADTIKTDDGAELRYLVEGSGPDLLLVSGLGGTAAFWDPVVPELARTARVIRADARGIAGSTRGQAKVDIARLARDCLAVLDATGSRNAAIVGHSTGGVIAQEIGLEHPGRISGLCLSGTWAKADRYMQALFRSRLEVLRAAPREYAAGTVFLGYPAQWLRDNWQVHEAALANAPVSAAAQNVVAERIAALLAFDRAGDLARLNCPVLVNGAEDDQIVPAYLQRELAAAIPAARLAMLAGGNHFYPLTRREEFLGVLGGWLREVG